MEINLYNYLFSILWSIIFAFLFYLYLKDKIDYKIIKNLLIIWLITIFTKIIINKTILFFQLKNHSVYKYLLPPHSDAFFTFIKRDLIYYYSTIIIAFFICLVLYFIAKKTEESFIDYLDIGLIFLGCLVVGWSNLIVYFLAIFVWTIIGFLGLIIIKKIKTNEPLAITPFIILATIFTLVIGYKLSFLTGLY